MATEAATLNLVTCQACPSCKFSIFKMYLNGDGVQSETR